MTKLSMVCGVDCCQGDSNCNGYCTGKAEAPPEATPSMVLAAKRTAAFAALREAEKAWYDYFGECEVGAARIWASDVYETIRTATRRG